MGIVLMPRAESDVSSVTAVLPVGSPSERMIAVRDRLLAAADTVIAANGGEERYEGTRAVISGNEVQARIYLSDPDTRPVSTTELTGLWRKQVGTVTGLESLKFQADRGGPGAGSSLEIELSHRDIDVLERASVDLAARLAEFPLVSDIDDGSAAGKKQISFNLRPEGISLGLTGYDIARQIRAAFYGAEALRQQRGNNEVTVLVRLPESERAREYDLEEFMVKTPAGTYVPLRQVADVTWGRAYTTITRRDGRRTVSVTGDVNPIGENTKVKNALAADVLPQLAADYPGLSTSFQGRHATMAESMQSLMASFVFAVLAIYILLAIPFRSYVQPIIVMAALADRYRRRDAGPPDHGLQHQRGQLHGRGGAFGRGDQRLPDHDRLRQPMPPRGGYIAQRDHPSGRPPFPADHVDHADHLRRPRPDDLRDLAPSAVHDPDGNLARLRNPVRDRDHPDPDPEPLHDDRGSANPAARGRGRRSVGPRGHGARLTLGCPPGTPSGPLASYAYRPYGIMLSFLPHRNPCGGGRGKGVRRQPTRGASSICPQRIVRWISAFCVLGGAFGFSPAAIAQTAPSSDSPLTIAIDGNYPPFSILTPAGRPAGLLVEMWKAWSEATGTPITFRASTWDGTFKNLREERADIHSGLFEKP